MNKEDKEKLSLDTKDKIALRTNWLKIIVILVLTIIIGVKLILSDLNFDFSKFEFSDLLSLILAIFSIGLAVAFYFKATDTSNQFYDNTYKFTRDISNILGRIESGFGERLRHLDEGYSGLINKFDNGVGGSEEKVEEVKKEFENEKEKLETEIREKEEILENLIKRAQLEEGERESILSQLREKEKEIDNQSRELHYLKRQLRRAETNREIEIINNIPMEIQELVSEIIKNELDISTLIEAPIDYLRRRIKITLEKYSDKAKYMLEKYDLVSPDGRLSTIGAEVFKSIALRMK